MRPRLAIAFLVAVAGALPAQANSAYIRVRPSSVPAGGVVRVSGSVDGGCPRGDLVTLISRAFSHRHDFAGLPAIYTRVGRRHRFAVRTRIPRRRRPASYRIGGRCGGGSFGGARLRVTT